ncbi:hypothetical protein [Nonomuraea sp. NPDC046570]|uniref:hypothetical protein n=1 Tax=Nonomuraea sp. NPDC046570 TaxID=3155255 RepID=UPI0033C1D79B
MIGRDAQKTADQGVSFTGSLAIRWARPGAGRAGSAVMLATRSARSGRPAASRAGRLAAHALLAISLVFGVVFAHGGACAAVELAEPGSSFLSHSAARSVARSVALSTTYSPVGGLVGVELSSRCAHRELPVGHQHGTEQDCLAITAAGPAGPLVPAAPPVAASTGDPDDEVAGIASSRPAAADRLAGPCPNGLCVMRI